MSHELANALAKLSDREAALTRWVAEHRDAIDSQAHLQEGSPQRTYWMYGQLTAIRDVMQLIQSELSAGRTPYSQDRAS
jgi:hypothetical protein